MANIAPSFITGAKAVVKVYDKALAFCSDVSYNINVQHVPVEAIGIFEIISNEPVAYTVDGSFSVIRYASGEGQLQNFADSLNEGDLKVNTASNIADQASGANLKEHIDPAQIITSQTFDLEVVEKTSNGGNDDTPVTNSFFKITQCRITRRGSSLNKRGLLIDNYSFVGIAAHDTVNEQADSVGTSAGGS